jgi:hypothetical protein
MSENAKTLAHTLPEHPKAIAGFGVGRRAIIQLRHGEGRETKRSQQTSAATQRLLTPYRGLSRQQIEAPGGRCTEGRRGKHKHVHGEGLGRAGREDIE